MGKKELFRRYLIFTVALFFSAFGVSLVTKSYLGTSPISSIPYVMSLNTPLTMGTYIFILNMILIAAQMLMLGRRGIVDKKIDLLMQIPVSVLFGVFIDVTMAMLGSYNPSVYVLKIVSLIAGCAVLALGISLEVVADVTMVSGEYTVQIASKRFKAQFGTMKIAFDVTLVVIAVALSFILSGHIEGLREGTVIVALLTGPFVRLISPWLDFLRRWEVSGSSSVTEEIHAGVSHTVITISREYGSGGHMIGERLAKALGYKFYDSELITLVAKEAGFTENFVRKNEQSLPGNMLLQMILQDYGAPLEKSLSPADALFVAQSRVIRRIAAEGPCVIVGRCADYILKDYPDVLKIFLHADMSSKAKRVTEQYGITPEKALPEIERINKSREEHYHHYTGNHWGDIRNYNLTFDTGRFGIDRVCTIIQSLVG